MLSPKNLLADKTKAILVVIGIVAIAAFTFYLWPREIVAPNPNTGALTAIAKIEAEYAAKHEQEVAKHEAEAKAHEAAESNLSVNIARLKRELEAARKDHGSVGGTEPSAGGGDDSPVVQKLQEIVAEQDKLIVEVTADRDSLKVALVESKLATEGYKKSAEKSLENVALLQANVDRVTAQAKAEITRAEWRGGVKGAALAVVLKSLF